MFVIVYILQNIGGNKNSPNYLNIMVNYHYYDGNRVIIRYFPSVLSERKLVILILLYVQNSQIKI